MPSSVMLRRVALLRTDVSEERCASIMEVTRIGELGTSNRRTLRKPISIDLVWKPDGNRELGRSRHRRQNISTGALRNEPISIGLKRGL
jgi:hypothetical protein